MIINVPGEFYVFETDMLPDREEMEDFFQDKSENDVLELHVKIDPRQKEQIYHISKTWLKVQGDFVNLAFEKAEDTFEKAAMTCPYYVPAPVMDRKGNCISIIKKIPSYYDHFYRYDGELDLSFLNRYSCIILHGLNEYSVEIYKRVLPLWQGREVYLIDMEWREYLDVLPAPPDIQVNVLDCVEDFFAVCKEAEDKKTLHIVENLPQNEDNSRYEEGIMCYDEVMTLTFMFSYVIHPGTRNPGKRFFVIDGRFVMEGIYGIWLKVFTAARYALSKGYIPIFKIVSSDSNIYSDYEYDDIWNKFFYQPEGYTIEEVLESNYLALSPNMNVLNIMRYIMDEVSEGYDLSWPDGIFNEQIKKYIRERKERFLPHPERTLGVLLRGTDYTKTRLTGHAEHATPEMIIEKVAETENTWDFDWIYLATEDEEICMKMKKHYGDRLTFTDQERYVIKPGQILQDLHVVKKEGEGFRLGAEYICAVSLLAQCGSLIASGDCGAYREALRENGGRYKHVYKFEL